MKKEFEELKEYTDKLLKSFPINMLETEKDILHEIDKVFEDSNAIDIGLAKKIVDNIEIYLKTKEKMIIQQNDFEFLKELAKELREQEIRKVDKSNPPMFKIVNSIGENMYYLTRKSAKEYSKVNNNAIFEPVDTNSWEIGELEEIIKRNF